METLTLTLHKAKSTKNKVVYGTQDGSVIQSVYIDRESPSTRSRRNPRVKGAVIIAVRTRASGSTPATVTFRDRTTIRKRTATARIPPEKMATRAAHERLFKATSGRSKEEF